MEFSTIGISYSSKRRMGGERSRPCKHVFTNICTAIALPTYVQKVIFIDFLSILEKGYTVKSYLSFNELPNWISYP